MRLTAIDLFSGAGGMTLGLQEVGFDVLFAADSWSPAVRTHEKNFAHPVATPDLAGLSANALWEEVGLSSRAIDLVVGGPPCQGFSVQRIGADKDSRNSLVLEFGRLVRELQPRMFLMENVPGFLGKRGRHLVAQFEEEMIAGGFSAQVVALNAADFGVPQNRKRVFYWGTSVKELSGFCFPRPTHAVVDHRTVWDAIGDLPEPPMDYAPSAADPLHRRTRLSDRNLERMRHIPPGGGMQDLPPELRVNCHREGAKKIGHRFVYGRLASDKPAATITARFDSFTRGKFGHPSDDRNITLREGARLQTFADSHRFEGTQEEIAAQIGNAVPPLLAGLIARALSRHMSGEVEQPPPGGKRTMIPVERSSAQLALFVGSKGA